jgi:histidine transport system permease protein
MAVDFIGFGRWFSGGFFAIARVSDNKFIKSPIWLFTYVFRGTPLYVQLLVFYSGVYTLEIVKGSELLNAFFVVV